MSDNITKRVGLGTAYGFAKAGGYEGTVAEFTELLGNIAIDLARIENLSVTVTTLPAGSQATASLNGSVLSLGIPKGDKGDKGNTGETGAPAGFGTVSATVDDTIGTPSVEVTASGADTAKNFAFAFHNLKGQKGDKGDTGEVSQAEFDEAVSDLRSDIDERGAFEDPYLYHSASKVVSGTGTYVFKDIIIDGATAGKVYTATVESVVGATKEQPMTLYFMDSSDNTLDSASSNATYTNAKAYGTAPANTSYLKLRLYASSSGAVTATYNNVKVFEGESVEVKLNPTLADIIEPLEESFVSNVVINKETHTVSGTGTYVFKDLFIEPVEPNTVYTFFCKKITGALNSYPEFLETMIGESTEEKIQGPKDLYENVLFSIKTSDDTTKIRVRLYPSTSGATTATYEDVFVLKNVDYAFGRTPATYLSSNIITLNAPYTEAKLVPTIASIAHRGYWRLSTECLKQATINAKRVGFDWTENDLNITSDGQYVMWHDSNLAKVGLPNVNISDVTLAYLKGLDLDGDEFLTFKEWVYLCKKLGLKMRVDSKITITDAIAEALVSIVREAGMLDYVAWVGYLNIRNYDSKATIVLVNDITAQSIESYSSYLENGKVIFHPHISNITAQKVAMALNAGFGVECWTMEIDSTYGFATHEEFVDACVNAIDCGVQGISCDNNTVYSILQEAGY